MLVLKRLKVMRYRNVAPGTELRFHRGVNLVLGQNASGKTTLLSLLSAVCRSTFQPISREEFELEYELEDEWGTVSASVSHLREPSSGIDVVFGAGLVWSDRYEVVITLHETQQKTALSSTDPHAVDLIMDWSFISAALSNFNGAFAEVRSALLQEFAFSFRFDESIDCFLAIVGAGPPFATRASPPLAITGILMSGGVVLASGGEFVPIQLTQTLQNRFQQASSPRDLSDLGDTGDELGRVMAEALDVTRVTILPNVSSFSRTKNDQHFMVNGFTFEITRADGSIIHHDNLSYGEKRMLAFFYYLAGNSSAVIADELVNGLHHKWIDRCMAALSHRQAFLTSQNPVLFDYVEFDSPAMVENCLITCELHCIAGREQMVWGNMSVADAKRFYDDYEVGIMHVGDLLKVKGLW